MFNFAFEQVSFKIDQMNRKLEQIDTMLLSDKEDCPMSIACHPKVYLNLILFIQILINSYAFLLVAFISSWYQQFRGSY